MWYAFIVGCLLLFSCFCKWGSWVYKACVDWCVYYIFLCGYEFLWCALIGGCLRTSLISVRVNIACVDLGCMLSFWGVSITMVSKIAIYICMNISVFACVICSSWVGAWVCWCVIYVYNVSLSCDWKYWMDSCFYGLVQRFLFN